ncbi:hypothetical protein [Desulfobacula phenolica]|nr:hypothetical protein [Desulfobacula phenolica]
MQKSDMPAFEKCLSNGHKEFIQQCSFSLAENKPNYPVNVINNFLYVFKFLNDQWHVTDKPIRTLKKVVLKALFLILISRKPVNNKTDIIEKTAKMIEKTWIFCLSDFPFLERNEEKEIISLLPPPVQKSIESEFANLNFKEKISSNSFLQIYPGFVENLKRQYDVFRNNTGKYKFQDDLLLKVIFIGLIERGISEKYPGATVLLPFSCLLKEITKINSNILEQSSPPPVSRRVFFNVSKGCYISEKLFIKKISEGYKPLPGWAIWLFKAGEKLAAAGRKKKNIVLGLSLPTRAYAALFFLLGYETRNALQGMKNNNNDSKYFHNITRMEKNTPLLIWEKERWKRCYAKGVKTVQGQEMFSVSVPGTDNTRHDMYIPKGQIFRLREAVDPEREVGDHQLGYSMRGFDFFRNYYGQKDENLLKHLISCQSRFTVVGNKTLLKNEGDRLAISIKMIRKSKKNWLAGSLLDIVRFEPFLLSEFDLSRGTVLSPEAVNEYNAHPNLLVFDGSLSFLNHYDDLEADMKVIFLDRSEPHFSEACRVMLEQNYSDRENDDDMLLYDTLPETIEAVIFEE